MIVLVDLRQSAKANTKQLNEIALNASIVERTDTSNEIAIVLQHSTQICERERLSIKARVTIHMSGN